jgi:hypothetical protein
MASRETPVFGWYSRPAGVSTPVERPSVYIQVISLENFWLFETSVNGGVVDGGFGAAATAAVCAEVFDAVSYPALVPVTFTETRLPWSAAMSL